MAFRKSHAPLIMALFILYATASASKSMPKPTQFENFFPGYRSYFENIRDSTCADLYAHLRSGVSGSDAYCPQLMSCLLTSATEDVKANLASASVLLGLMPTMLASLSSSPSETALLGRRRPILALLLTLGSPAVDAVRLFSRPDPVEELLEHTLPAEHRPYSMGTSDKMQPLDRASPPKAGRRSGLDAQVLHTWLNIGQSSQTARLQSIAVVTIEYLLATAAIANVIVAAVYAGLWTINTTSCSANYLPILWVFLTPVAHLASMLALALRTRPPPPPMEETCPEQERATSRRKRTSLKERFWKGVRDEFTPCSAQKMKLKLDLDHNSVLFILISWFISVWTVAYVLYGTVAYSTLMFISYLDGLRIVGRFMASAIVCRMVLMFELAGMRYAAAGEHSVENAPSEVCGKQSAGGKKAPYDAVFQVSSSHSGAQCATEM